MNIQEELIRFQQIVKSFEREQTDKEDYSSYLNLFKNPTFRLFIDHTQQGVAVYNYLEQRYEYVSNSIRQLVNEEPSAIQEDNGIMKVIGMLSPASSQMMIDEVTPLLFEYTQKHSDQINDLRFTSCVEMIFASGERKWILFHNYVLCCTPQKFPVLSCTIVTDVTSIKRDGLLSYSVHLNNKLLLNKVIGQQHEDSALSDREKQVVELLSQGQTTQQIADQLFISFETVKKHRSNILKKTNCSNTAELMNIASTMGIL